MGDFSDWLNGILDTGGDAISGVVSAVTDPFSQGLSWIGDNVASLFSDTSSTVDAADAAGAGLGIGAETGAGAQTAIDAANAASPEISSPSWLQNKMDDLAKWAKSDKGAVAIGTGLAAAAKYSSDKARNKIIENHYRQQDALMEQKQNNAMTSGANLNVGGLIASQQFKDVPGGFNDRRARNMGGRS